jgi:glycosyltransferase involved in cell wall biosynthesis
VNVLVVTHFYPPEPGAGATRVASLVASLERAGHDVTLLTGFPSFPRGRFTQRPSVIHVERAGRVRTVRLFSFLIPGLPGGRLLHWLSSAVAASLYAIAVRERYDVVIMSSPPITLAMPALVAAWRHRSRLVVDVRDVFPDIAVQMGVWKSNGFFTRAVERVVRILYRRADLIAAVTPTAISQIAQRGVDPARLILARNAAERSPDVPAHTNGKRGFTAVYAGNLGLTTDIDVLVDAAALVAPNDITIEIVGDGAQRVRLDDRIHKERVSNVVVRGSVPRQDAMAMVAGADVSIIPLRKGIEESIPTKLYDSLSVGCPVLVVADGEAKREGELLGALCTPPGDAQALAAALRQLSLLDKAALRRIGDLGKANVEKRADRACIMDELTARIGGLH